MKVRKNAPNSCSTNEARYCHCARICARTSRQYSAIGSTIGCAAAALLTSTPRSMCSPCSTPLATLHHHLALGHGEQQPSRRQQRQRPASLHRQCADQRRPLLLLQKYLDRRVDKC